MREVSETVLSWRGGRTRTPAGTVFALAGINWIAGVADQESWGHVDIVDVAVLGILAEAGLRLGAMTKWEYLAARNALLDHLDRAQRQALFGSLARASVTAAVANEVSVADPWIYAEILASVKDDPLPESNDDLLALPGRLPAEVTSPSSFGEEPGWPPARAAEVEPVLKAVARSSSPRPRRPAAMTPREALAIGLHATARHPDVQQADIAGPLRIYVALAMGYDLLNHIEADHKAAVWLALPTASSAQRVLKTLAGMCDADLEQHTMSEREALAVILGHPASTSPLDSTPPGLGPLWRRTWHCSVRIWVSPITPHPQERCFRGHSPHVPRPAPVR